MKIKNKIFLCSILLLLILSLFSFTYATEELKDIGNSVKNATEDVGDNQMRLLYLTTENFITKSVNDTVAGGNYELMMNAVSKMANHETSVSVPAKSYQMATLTLTKVQSLLWGMLVVLILPLSLLASGLIIWARRRKR